MPALAKYVVQHPTNFVAGMMSAWIDNTARLLGLEERAPERCFRIRYEDLVTAPESTLRPLLAFIGVAWEEDLLAAVFSTPHDKGGGDPKILVTNRIDASRVGAGQRINLALIPEPIRLAAEPLNARLSYPALAPGRRLPWPAASDQGRTDDSAAGGSGRSSVEDTLRERLSQRATLAGALQGTCRLVVEGPGGGSWKLHFTGGVPAIGADEGPADCSLVASLADFREMLEGRANPVVALLQGKLSVEGNREIAQVVGRMIAQ
jgi:protein-tyrosine sulfotransferase